MLRIGIVGNGFSGLMSAVHLLEQRNVPVEVFLVGDGSQVGDGLGFKTSNPHHLLNVPAGRMSAYGNKPDDFLSWCQRSADRYPELKKVTSLDFVPRCYFGEYLRDLLKGVLRSVEGFHLFYSIEGPCLDIREADDQQKSKLLDLGGGKVLAVDRVVLAVSNFVKNNNSCKAWGADQGAHNGVGRVIVDPWNQDQLKKVGRHSRVMFIGTGLTMVDVALSLKKQGHYGAMTALSRHGLVPRSHRVDGMNPPAHWVEEFKHEIQGSFSFGDQELGVPSKTQLNNLAHKKLTLIGLFGLVRKKIKSLQSSKGDWRWAIDALRPITQALWQALAPQDQERFLRHLKHYWDVHRHRMPPSVGLEIEAMMSQKALQVIAGRILGCSLEKDHMVIEYQGRHQINQGSMQKPEKVVVDVVIDCTGYKPGLNELLESHLWLCLYERGFINVHRLGLGIDVTKDGRTIDRMGRAVPWLFAMGSMRTGLLLESTAVPELREQASRLSDKILSHL